ncbi:MAG TPA: condensation domain-containing protein, partial [Blastocatellia bacterium]|nr:condensation domain-containing protein [Blastocatellia bacterium]
MSASELLSHLQERRIKLWLDDDGLRYSAPKGKLTPELLGQLKQYKAEIISFLRKADGVSEIGPPPIRPVPRNGPAPLSFAQQRLWFLDQLEGGSQAYNIPLVWRIDGAVSVQAFASCFTEIVRRHEALRTSFKVIGGTAVQIVTPPEPVKLALVDLQEWPEDSRTKQAHRLVLEQIDRPFDLSHPCLLRTTLIRLEPKCFAAVVTVHHISCDGWSVGVLVDELTALYERFSTGRKSLLMELPVQYADFAYWQNQWLQGDALERQLNYWKKQLDGAPSAIEMPTDRARPPVQTFSGKLEKFDLSSSLREDLKSLSRRSGATMSVILLTAFKALLARYNGQEDILVGSPVANRTQKAMEPMIGFFANTLVMRTRLSGNPRFRDLLLQVRDVAMAAYAHQDIPFEKLVEELNPERELNRNPIVQTLFILQNATKLSLKLGDLELSPWDSYITLVRFDLELHFWDIPDGLLGTLMYNTELFDDATIVRMAGHCRTLLEAAAKNPDVRLWDMPLLTEAERKELLQVSEAGISSFTGAPAPLFAGDRSSEPNAVLGRVTVHELFEDIVERQPNAQAVSYGDQGFTYRQLNSRANKLARRLKTIGVHSGSLVPLILEPSPELVIGMLAVLKAGGAFLLVEPNAPQGQLEWMLADITPASVLTRQSLQHRIAGSGASVFLIASDDEEVASNSPENLSEDVSTESLACVTYHGHTALAIDHNGIRHRLVCLQQTFDLSPSGAMLATEARPDWTPIHQFLWPLVNGARVVIADSERRNDPGYLMSLIESQKVSAAQFSPSELHALSEVAVSPKVPPGNSSLRKLLCVGGPLNSGVIEKFRHLLNCEVRYSYGVNEGPGLIVSDARRTSADGKTIPAGLPVGLSVYILDRALNLQPLGVPGELYLGGRGLPVPYLDSADLDRRRYVENPFADSLAPRLFRTGYLARRANDGQIEILGNTNREGWIAGRRISLSEV